MSNNESDKEFEQLKLLFEYTKFHILLYTTLITLLIGLFTLGVGDGQIEKVEKFRAPMKVVIVYFLIAGGAGGVVASSIPHHKDKKISTFVKAKISPYNIKWLKLTGQEWIDLEHLMFWVGILIAVGSFIFM